MLVLMKDFFSSTKREIETNVDGSKNQTIQKNRSSPRGIYADLNGDCVCLFTLGTGLFISINGEANEIRQGDMPVTYGKKDGLCVIRVKNGPNERLISYASQDPVSTPFYSEDEEDADFGLWLFNVLRSDERRKIVVSAWAN